MILFGTKSINLNWTINPGLTWISQQDNPTVRQNYEWVVRKRTLGVVVTRASSFLEMITDLEDRGISLYSVHFSYETKEKEE